MRLRHRFILLTSTVLLLAVGILTWYVDRQVRRGFAATLDHYENQSIEYQREHLRSVVSLALGLAEQYKARAQRGEFSDTEARRRFLTALQALRYDNGIGYFWVHELRPQAGETAARVVMHATSPGVVSTVVDGWTDLDRLESIVVDGKLVSAHSPLLAERGIFPTPFLRVANALCEGPERGGFVEYYWKKPRADTVPTAEGYLKLSFVRLIPDWNWVIGSGIYLDDIEADVAARRSELDARFRETLWTGSIVVILILAGSVLVTLLVSRRMTRPLSVLADTARAIAAGDRPPFSGGAVSHDEVGSLQEAFAKMGDAIASREDELRERTHQLERLNEDLRILSRTKGMILANVSHELKTPLATIRGYCELLRSGSFGPLHELQREKLTHCIRKADELTMLINEILSFAEVGSRVPGALVPLDLRDVVRRGVSLLQPRAVDREIALEIDIAETPVIVLAESDRLEHVFRRLVDNAVKFSSPGGAVRIAVRSDPVAGRAVVRIRDDGQGIPPAELERIFSGFYQVDPTPSRRHGGLGLGLAISKLIVEQSGGSIRVESAVERGTTVIVDFPLAPGGGAESATISSESPSTGDSGNKGDSGALTGAPPAG